MPNQLEVEFHEAMLDIYRKAKSEARYNAQRFLQMVVDTAALKRQECLSIQEQYRMVIPLCMREDVWTLLLKRWYLFDDN